MPFDPLQFGLALIGGIIVLGALAQIGFGVARSVQDVGVRRRQRELQLARLQESVATATLSRRMAEQQVSGSWSGVRKFRINAKRQEADSICSFYLVPHDGKQIPAFKPGQYLTFALKLSGRDKPLVRCYSLSDSPMQRDHYRVTIKCLGAPPGKPDMPPGLSSNFFHKELREGDIVDIKAPVGSFWLDLAGHRPVVLIAGGVGVTPLFSMLKAIVDSKSQRDAWFFYGLRHGGEHVFREELDQFEAACENVHVRACYGSPRDGDTLGVTHQIHERVSVDLLKRSLPSNNFEFYICGPPPMMSAITEGLKAWGVPDEDIHTEAFGPASVKKVEKPVSSVFPQPQITFARSGKTVAWNDADNLLEFAESVGIRLDSGCRAGSCGTCVTAVKSGEVAYIRDSDAKTEAGSCLVCVARPRTNLILDA